MTDTSPPPVTVVISTRDRGNLIAHTIATLVLNTYARFEVIVVDQSADDRTHASVQPFLDHPRIRYIRTPTIGVSAGRNIGIADAKSEFIAITDDDCEVPANWLEELVAAFAVHPRIGIVCGNVVPGPHDPALGFVPAYVRTRPFLARGIRQKHHVEGISACMGLRRTVWQVLGGFDLMLGVGAPLKSGAESDLTIRALLAGHYVYETPNVVVIHHGFRTWEQGRLVVSRYWYGTGAAFAKQLKCGHWSVVLVLFHLAWRWAFGRSRVAASLGSRPQTLLRLVSFVRGFVAGGLLPADRTSGHYLPRRRS